MYNFTFHRPTTVRQAAGLLARNPEAKLLGRRPFADPGDEAAAGEPVGADRSLAGRRHERRRAEGPLDRDRRHDAPCRRRQFDGAAAGAAGAGRGAGLDRRSAGAQPRHHRRLDRQQRSERRLSGGRASGWAPPSSPTSGASRPTISSPACSRPRWKTARSSPRSASRSPRRRPTRSSSTRPRASRWSACSCRKRGSDIRVAVTGAGSNGVFRVKSFEEALKKRFAAKSLEGMTIPATGMNSDIHASPEYRAHLVGVLARRAVAKATA